MKSSKIFIAYPNRNLPKNWAILKGIPKLSTKRRLKFSFMVIGNYEPSTEPDSVTKVVGISDIFSNHNRSTRIGFRRAEPSDGPYQWELVSYRYLNGERIVKKIIHFDSLQTINGFIDSDGDIFIARLGNYETSLNIQKLDTAPTDYGTHKIWRLSTVYFMGKTTQFNNGVLNVYLNIF